LIQLGNFPGSFADGRFLNELALLTNMAKEENLGEEGDEDKVALSTIHQAKGLEWSYRVLDLVRWTA